jgi:hypothetical protein
MPRLAEVVDAVIGGDTHRDRHALDMTAPGGVRIATWSVSNDERGFADTLAWIAEHAPGRRVVVALEGTRSYGIGLSRALRAARAERGEDRTSPPRRAAARQVRPDRRQPGRGARAAPERRPAACSRRAPSSMRGLSAVRVVVPGPAQDRGTPRTAA